MFILCPNNILFFRPCISSVPSVFVCTFFLCEYSLYELAYLLKYDKARYFLKIFILDNRIKWTKEDADYIVPCLFRFIFSFTLLSFEKVAESDFLGKLIR